MSTERGEAGGRTGLEQLARGADRTLIRLAILSPLALLAFLVIDEVQEYGLIITIAAVVIAMIWAAIDVHS